MVTRAIREAREAPELAGINPERETQAPAAREVVLDQRLHRRSRRHDRTSPGHGNATPASADRSTLA